MANCEVILIVRTSGGVSKALGLLPTEGICWARKGRSPFGFDSSVI